MDDFSADGGQYMNQETAANWCELQTLLFQDAWNDKWKKYISPYVFRGLPKNYPLKTKFSRLSHDGIEHRTERENGLYRSLKKYAQKHIDIKSSFWHCWSLGQHYGLATRLLDWTYSPLVAAHFATAKEYPFEKDKEEDGVIWAVNFKEAHKKIPDCLKKKLCEADLFTVDMLPKQESFSKFDGLYDKKFVLFFEPPSFDQRIVNQFAVFSVMNEPRTSTPPTIDEPMENWLVREGIVTRKIIIPSEKKAEIRQKLDQCNISERILFPGLDGICRWLNRHYAPSPLWNSNQPVSGFGMIPNDWEYRTCFVKTVKEFLILESFILKEGLNERTITHKLAEYLQRIFPNFDVDCEYNKMPKKEAKKYVQKTLDLDAEKIGSDDERAVTVYPDIIVHERSHNESNYLVIEVKKKEYAELKRRRGGGEETYREFDFRKLKAYIKHLNYTYGIYIEFNQDNISDLKFLTKESC